MDLDDLCARFVKAQLAGDRCEALRLVMEEGVGRGAPTAELSLHIIEAAQREIGLLWQDNKISVADEHLATAIAQVVLAHLYRLSPPRRSSTSSSSSAAWKASTTRLEELLGGTLTVESKLGEGSTFTLTIPATHPEVRELATHPLDPSLSPVLIVEDDRKTMLIYEKFLSLAGFQVVPARTVDDARKQLDTFHPTAIVLDIMLEGEVTWDFLAEVKQSPETREIPVLVVTVTNKEQRARARRRRVLAQARRSGSPAP